MKYDDYIWDLGGTLLDNYESSAQAFEGSLKRFNIEVSHLDIYNALKHSTDYAIQKFASDIPNFLKIYKEVEREYLAQPVLFADAKKVLSEIVDNGGRNFMISHRDNHVLEILDATNIHKYFTEVVTSDNGFARKPDPQSVDYLIKKYQMSNAVMIGDRLLDIKAGINAGISTIYFSNDEYLLQADQNIKSLSEILDL
ncbi:DNA gyrase subunit B [Floricoccus tropicus]|uniref:DNA gyrase subunit B n=1 Tax=Floricoccus tropicus TaxID=1859473 RepID=A0A1E8GNZ2_9LACT|nr:HAD-IA family hydrolase [Floricoccus tropicus]OFI49969.1 DNA gyrase subunit B [Floricoccus tropicus]